MRKIVFRMHADTVGTDAAELHIFQRDEKGEVSNRFLDNYAYDLGIQWADMFMPDIYGEDSDYEEEGQYYEACGWWWEDYDPVKHAGMVDDPDEE